MAKPPADDTDDDVNAAEGLPINTSVVLVHSQPNVMMQTSRIGYYPSPETNRPARTR
jgi:hypothetical protein